MVFGLGGDKTEFPPPNNLPPSFRSAQSAGADAQTSTMEFTPASLAGSCSARPSRAARRSPTAAGPARIKVPRTLVVRPWNPNTSNWQYAFGKVFLGKSPVVGARLRVDGFTLPAATGPQGGFSYPADITEPGRHEVRVIGVDRAKVHGRKLTTAQQNALQGRARGNQRRLSPELAAREGAVERNGAARGPDHELGGHGAAGRRPVHVQA